MTLFMHRFGKHIKNSMVLLLSIMMLAAYCPVTGFAETSVVNYVDAAENPYQCDHYVTVYENISAMSDG